MPPIRVANFKGKMPQVSPKLLPENFAQTALNVDVRTGKLQPIYQTDLHDIVYKATPAKIFKCDTRWESWPTVVDVVRGWVYDTNPHFYTSDGIKPKQTMVSLIFGCFLGLVLTTESGDILITESGDTLVREGNEASIYYDLGIPAPASAPTFTFIYDGDTPGNAIQATIAYVFTYVAILGNEQKESAPSPPSRVAEIMDDGYCSVSCPTPIEERAVSTNISKIRIYRVASGTTGAEYLFLSEVSISQASTSFKDRGGSNWAITPVADLGEAIKTEGWDPPPDELQGLISFTNGLMAGFVGNKVLINEPFIPYAFPDEYEKQFESDVVALGFIGNSLIVTTKTHPYIGIGTDPQSIILDKLPDQLGNLAKRGTISTPFGVAYPSPEGLVLVNTTGGRLVTKGIITKKQWNALTPANLISCYYDDKYYGFFINTNTGIICDFMAAEPYLLDITLNDYPGSNAIQVKDLYVDTETDTLYLLVYSADTKYYVLKYEKHSTNKLTYDWKSKRFSFPRPTNLGAGRIKKSSGNVVFKLYAGGSLKKTATITSEAVFRLPSGFTETDWEFQVEATAAIDEVALAETADQI